VHLPAGVLRLKLQAFRKIEMAGLQQHAVLVE
jgi:hypothetical protein